MSPSQTQRTPAELQVFIFGAGIAGLTAAHELVERGFRVTVVEARPDPDLPKSSAGPRVAVGGIARTQWSYLPTNGRKVIGSPRPGGFQRTLRLTNLQLGFIAVNETGFDPADLEALLVRVRDGLQRHPGAVVLLGGYARAVSGEDWRDTARQRASAVASFLENRLGKDKIDLAVDAAAYGGDSQDGVELWLSSTPFPGEHGFRFFPSFYRHLFDTMRRTPIPRTVSAEEAEERDLTPQGERHDSETGATVYDNLEPARRIEVVVAGRKPFMVERSLPQSISAVLQLLGRSLDEVGCTLQDVARMQVKLFQYMTSCPERRAQYERMSWYQYVDADACSPALRRYLQSSSQALLALRGSEGDARTHGNILTQLLLDQLTTGDHSDSTLNGPTSVAWFDHWRRYLELQDVKFVCATLSGFSVAGDRVVPVVSDLDGNKLAGFDGPDAYYVLAADLPSARRLADSFVAAAQSTAAAAPDFEKLAIWLAPGWEMDLSARQPAGPLRHMSGIQFFFGSELFFPRAHTLYLDAPWGLSSVAQPTFWFRRSEPLDGFRGLLSVDVADWASPDAEGQSAWDVSDDEVARRTWRQVSEAYDLRTTAEVLSVTPAFYHLDEFIARAQPGATSARTNMAPFLIARPGEYARRPGNVDGPYAINGNRWVLAGNYMQTATRLSSMEAPNESARRAVNAFLDLVGFAGTRCAIFNPEANELPDLRPLRDLDARLIHADAPHFIEILGLEKLPDLIPSGDLAERLASLFQGGKP